MTRARLRVSGARPLAPRASADTARFWDALAFGEFLVTRCNACGEHSFPPRRLCSACLAIDAQWIPLAGTGRLYTRTVVHAAAEAFAPWVPYAVGIVDLDLPDAPNAIRILCALIDTPTPIAIDTQVELIVLDYDDGPLYAARATPSRSS